MGSTINILNQSTFPISAAAKFEAALTSVGKLNLLGIGLRIAPRNEAVALCDAFLIDMAAGATPAPLFFENVMSDASIHAAACTASENKAYCLAHYRALPSHARSDFWDFVSSMQVAA